MIRGKAVVQRGSNEIDVNIGTFLENQDTIQTEKQTKLQLTFNDKTVVTLGSNTTFKIEKFLYDLKKSKVNLNVEKGFFKVITGKIGKLAPKNFIFKTKTSLIGIRGTIFSGRVGFEGKDYIACIKGSILVSSIDSSKNYVINHGEMIYIDKDGSFGTPQELDQDSYVSANYVEQKSQDSSTNDSKTSVASSSIQSIVMEENKIVEDEEDIQTTKQDNINDLISKKVVANYSGKLNGTSNATYTTSSITKLTALVEADMDMRVDFGGNDPLHVNIKNQTLTLQGAKVDNVAVTGDDLQQLKQQLSSSDNFTSSMDMKQNIDTTNNKITGDYTKTSNGFTTTVELKGDFKDENANRVTGILNESTKGSANGVDIDRTIDASFDLSRN